jgi:ribosomal protein L40E
MRELTDSYCERCGTRYTFGPSPTKGPSLANARLLAKGLKNFVMTDGTSMDEAMAAARIDATKDESSRATEEFHRTFNFCMTCRQYACDKCWNDNQGACLSCAPLWDVEPVAPQDHLIIRTPVYRQDLGQSSRAYSPADGSPRAADSPAPWPAEDPLSGQSAAREGGTGHFPVDTTPTVPTAQTTLSPQAPRPGPAERPAQPRPPARISEDERSAAQQLRAQSQAWKSQDDGWTLWPLDGKSSSAEMTLTPEELSLVKAQLHHAPTNDEPAASPTPAAALDAEAFTSSDTLDEDAARVTEPETPAPTRAPSSDFDLLGSLRQPIELPQPPVDAEPRHAPGIGRLLGHHAPAAETPHKAAPKAPKTARPAKVPRQKSAGQATPWPVATPWVDRPMERHDWWADTDAAPIGGEPPVDTMPVKIEEPFVPSAEFESPTPVAPEPVAAAMLELEPKPAQSQQPLFTMPPATTDRWAATRPDIPTRAPAEWPVADPVDDKRTPATPAARRPDQPASWPPFGASWPSPARPAAPWSVPQSDLVAASVAAAAQAERAEMAESPLIAALWAESAQQVLDRGSVRVCHHCALPVSTQARYCRRCGTKQG